MHEHAKLGVYHKFDILENYIILYVSLLDNIKDDAAAFTKCWLIKISSKLYSVAFVV